MTTADAVDLGVKGNWILITSVWLFCDSMIKHRMVVGQEVSNSIQASGALTLSQQLSENLCQRACSLAKNLVVLIGQSVQLDSFIIPSFFPFQRAEI